MMDKVSDGAGWGSLGGSFKSKQGVDSIAIIGSCKFVQAHGLRWFGEGGAHRGAVSSLSNGYIL